MYVELRIFSSKSFISQLATPLTSCFALWLDMELCGACNNYLISPSLQCRRILGGRNLVRVRNIVVAAIFDFMTVEDWEE